MNAKTLEKTYGIKIGKTYIAGNDEKVIVTGVGRRAYDKAVILFCKVEKNGEWRNYDASLNSVSGWKGWNQ